MKINVKVDDFRAANWKATPWQKFFLIVGALGIKISLGIIGFGMEGVSEEGIKFLMGKKDVEFYNHSYWHMIEGGLREFRNTPLEYQKESIRKTQEIVWYKLGLVMETIGFVANSYDKNTIAAIRESELKNIYVLNASTALENSGRKIIRINNCGYAEQLEGERWLDFERFKQVWSPSAPYACIQFHPMRYGEADLIQFEKIMAFLKTQGELVFSYET
jgi:hypothetical protein